MEIDSGVWPGVSSASSRTFPNWTASPSPHGLEGVLGLRGGAQIYSRARPVAKFQVAGEKVGVEMRQEYVRDSQPVLARKC